MSRESLKDNRYFGALCLIPLFLCFILGGWFLKLAVFSLALRAVYEFYNVVKMNGVKPVDMAGYLATVIYFILIFMGKVDFKYFHIITMMLTVIVLIVTVFRRNHGYKDAAVTVLGFLYGAALFALILHISNLKNGYWFVFTLFTISWLCDTLAYFTGRLFGKHKLIEEVSPKKTVEGAVGGLLGGALGTLLYGFILDKYGIETMPLYHFFIMGFFGAVFGQIGDLIASAIKREVGAKDYPKLIPGHGGVLDRFDSVIVVALFVYFYLTFIVTL